MTQWAAFDLSFPIERKESLTRNRAQDGELAVWKGSGIRLATLPLSQAARRAKALAGDLVAELETAIRTYLAAHPGAADSAAGIQRWWLPHSLSGRPLAELERVLAHMAATGQLAEMRLPDGSVMFGTLRRPGRPRPDDGTAPH